MPAIRHNNVRLQPLTLTNIDSAVSIEGDSRPHDAFEAPRPHSDSLISLPKAPSPHSPLILPPPMAPSSLAAINTPENGTTDISVVSKAKADQLFAKLVSRADIPFLSHEDGCFARAHQMVRILENKGIIAAKAFVHGNLRIRSPYSAQTNPYNGKVTDKGYIFWRYHVAVALWVQSETGRELMVIDPSICEGPVTVKEWIDRQTEVPGSSAREPYFTSRFIYQFQDRDKTLTEYDPKDLEHMKRTTTEYLTPHHNRVRMRAYQVSDTQRAHNHVLYQAVENDDLDGVLKAITNGADAAGVYGGGQCDHLLNTAIRCSNIKIVRALLDAGATHQSSLLAATDADNLQALGELLSRNAGDLTYSLRWSRRTALMSAVFKRQFAMVKLLLEASTPSEINHKGPEGRTALFFAVGPDSNHTIPMEDSIQLTRLLIEAGADVNVISTDGETPLSLIEKFERAQEKSTYKVRHKFLKTLRGIKKELQRPALPLRLAA